jgi:hypothetical protein
MNNWINAIIEFKKCEIVSKAQNQNKQVVNIKDIQEFNKVRLNKIAYNSNNKALVPSRHFYTHKQVMKKSVSSLLKSFHKGVTAHQRMRRIMRSRLSRQLKISQESEGQEMSVKKLMQKREFQERQNELKLIRIEAKHKELSLINQAKEKLRNVKVKHEVK